MDTRLKYEDICMILITEVIIVNFCRLRLPDFPCLVGSYLTPFPL
ncbi:hypothetical protein NUACC26_043400 [Scytonema sp. NUACC26]